MRQKDIACLKTGDVIRHKHYGLCIIGGYQHDFGPYIRPLEAYGINLLHHQSGTLFNRLLETSKRLILQKIDNPVIPKLIIKTGDVFQVYEWIEPGVISDKGVASVNLLPGQYNTYEEALKSSNPQ